MHQVQQDIYILEMLEQHCLIICLLGTIFIPKDLKYNYIQDREQKIQKLQNENIELNLTIQKYNLQKELRELRKQDVHN